MSEDFGVGAYIGINTPRTHRSLSARPCGCDPGADWVCEQHAAKDAEAPQATIAEVAPAPTRAITLPLTSQERKQYPVASGVLDYFPDALVAIAHVSYIGNKQHNPGESLHWAREKSTDQADTLIRHFLERGSIDTDGQRHTAKLCWRALALLQLELEQANEVV